MTSARSKAWTPERRAAQSARIRARFADPAIREMISERTKEGIRNAPQAVSSELQALRWIWNCASPQVRKRFLEEILSPVCSASASKDEPSGAE